MGNYKNQTKLLLFPYKLHVVTTLFAVHCCLQYITSFSIFFSRQRKVLKNLKSVYHLLDKEISVASILKSLYLFFFKEFTTSKMSLCPYMPKQMLKLYEILWSVSFKLHIFDLQNINGFRLIVIETLHSFMLSSKS